MGTVGNGDQRSRLDTAMVFTLPASIMGLKLVFDTARCTTPEKRSGNAAVELLYGTMVISTPAVWQMSSASRCETVPC